MKRTLTLALLVAAAGSMLAAEIVDARRLGGGRSLGAQRQAVQPAPKAPAAAPTQAAPTATPATPAAPPGAAANPVMPPGAAAAKAAPGAAAGAAAGTAARSGMSRWLGPVAGLAAGLGLAALAAHLGIAEELMSLMLVVLLALVGIAVVRALMARRAPARAPLPYAGAGPGLGRQPGGYETQAPPVFRNAAAPMPSRVEPSLPRTDAVARPIPGVPADFDTAGFLKQARMQFNRLQSAYDRNDRSALAQVMTAEMFADVAQQMDSRGAHVPTEVVELDAELLDVATEDGKHWASVRFRGLTREDGGATPQPFDEIWNLEKPVDGSSGWLLAGIRQLDSLPAAHA